MILDKINVLLGLILIHITDHPGSAFCINFLYMDRTSCYLIHSLGVALIQSHTIVSIASKQFGGLTN